MGIASRIFNYLIILILVASYTSVYFLHGLVGAFAWWMIKLVLPIVGLALLILTILLSLIKKIKKIKDLESHVMYFLSIVMILPVLTLINIITIPYPIDINQTDISLSIQSPFKEDVKVGWGGDEYEDNKPHVLWASERWAYDLIIEPANVKSDHLNDYGIYDREIFSPVRGRIVAAHDDEIDITPNSEDFISMEGNYVYIEVESTKTYLLFNHLKKGSVRLKVGDQVEVDDYLGRVGNSGSTSEPHLHIHHQRQNPTANLHPVIAEGLPLYFYDEGKSYMPKKDDIIKSSQFN